MNHTHRTCSAANPPSYYDVNCRLLAQKDPRIEAEIVDTNEVLITKCFAQFPGQTGWYVFVKITFKNICDLYHSKLFKKWLKIIRNSHMYKQQFGPK